MSDQLLFQNARFFPLGPIPPGADAMLVQNGRIAALGRSAGLAERLVPHAQVLELGGRVILPGFVDTHVHLAETGLLRQGVNLGPAQTVEQALDILAEAFHGRSDPDLFRAHSLDPSLMRERRYPRMEELDAISAEVPIFILRRDGHSCVVNSAFWCHCGLTKELPGIDLDPQTGSPTGTLRAQALEMAKTYRNRFLVDEDREAAVRSACREAIRKGVTTVHAMCARRQDVDLLAGLAGQLPVDVVPYLATMDVDLVCRLGLAQIGGDLLVDGSLGSSTAALFEPYADLPGERGLLYYDRKQLLAFVAKAHRAGLQVAMHAIGDRATDEVLSAYENALRAEPRRDHRHRIEHAELLRPDQIRRLAKGGIVLAVQPAFEAFWGGPDGMYARRLGPERVLRTNPFRALLDAGVIIAGGSDSYITPVDPLAGIAAAVGHPTPGHRLTPLEAVRMFTVNGAHLAFQERDKGLLSPGMKADLVVLPDDPREVSSEDISKMQICMVIKDGKVIFESASS